VNDKHTDGQAIIILMTGHHEAIGLPHDRRTMMISDITESLINQEVNDLFSFVSNWRDR
jgi:hypothetical protein